MELSLRKVRKTSVLAYISNNWVHHFYPKLDSCVSWNFLFYVLGSENGNARPISLQITTHPSHDTIQRSRHTHIHPFIELSLTKKIKIQSQKAKRKWERLLAIGSANSFPLDWKVEQQFRPFFIYQTNAFFLQILNCQAHCLDSSVLRNDYLRTEKHLVCWMD